MTVIHVTGTFSHETTPNSSVPAKGGLNAGDEIDISFTSYISDSSLANYSYNEFNYDSTEPSLAVYVRSGGDDMLMSEISSNSFGGTLIKPHVLPDSKFLINQDGHDLELKISTYENSGIGLDWETNLEAYPIKTIEVMLDNSGVQWNASPDNNINNINPFLEANLGDYGNLLGAPGVDSQIKITFDDNGSSNVLHFVLTDIEIATVPEPSTYALILGGLVIGIAFLRRR